MMGIPRIDPGPMTISEFYAFTETRPDEEKWELIEGEPVMNASPTKLHQIISLNTAMALRIAFGASSAWEVLQTIGLTLSETNRAEPDIIVRPKTDPKSDVTARDFSDAVVVFEILSPSTANRDLRWKRKAYASLPSVSDYVVIAQDTVEVVVFARKSDFAERRLSAAAAELDLPVIGVSLKLADIYCDTGLDKR